MIKNKLTDTSDTNRSGYGPTIKGSLLLSPKQTAILLNCGQSTLARHRSKGTGIPYVKIGKSVRYRVQDIFEFIDSKKIGEGLRDE